MHIRDEELPERREVDSPVDIIAADTPRIRIDDDNEAVFIVGAMINPKGNDRQNEWVSIINLSNDTIDLTDWKLSDTRRDNLVLGTHLEESLRTLEPGEAVRIKPVVPLELGNNGGVIELYGSNPERRVDRVKYTKTDVKDDCTVVFPIRVPR